MIGVEEGKGDEEMYGNGSTVQPLHPESIEREQSTSEDQAFHLQLLRCFNCIPSLICVNHL